RVTAKSDTPPPGKVIYILRNLGDPTQPDMIALRIPEKSRAIPMMESMLVKPVRNPRPTTSPPHRGTPQSVDPPDPS
ncbi:MAG TPA: hypothetical protein VGM78_00150, partial [Ilumatobacteraceae bacterium]